MNQDQFDKMWQMMEQFHLQFATDIEQEYKCGICCNVLINACVTPCDCRFCYGCINQYLTDGPKQCPMKSEFCGEDLLDINKHIWSNRKINMKISQFPVNCPIAGCKSIMELNELSNHLMICDQKPLICPSAITGCCEDKLARDRFDEMKQEMINMKLENRMEKEKLKNQQQITEKLLKKFHSIENEMRIMRSKYEQEKEEDRLKNQEITDKMQKKIDEMNVKMRTDQQNAQNAIQLLVQQVNAKKTEINSLNDEINVLKEVNRAMKEEMKSFNDKINQQINEEMSQHSHRLKTINSQFDALQLKAPLYYEKKEEDRLKNQEITDKMQEKIGDIKNEINNLKSKIELEKETVKFGNTETIDNMQETINQIHDKMKTDQQNSQNALQLLVQRDLANKKEIDLLNEEMYVLKVTTRSMKEENKIVNDKINERATIEQKTTEQISQINQRFESVDLRLNVSKEENRINHENLRSEIDKISHQIDQIKSYLKMNSSDEINQLVPVKQSNEFIWIIKNWSQHLTKVQQNKNGHYINVSDQFESHSNGYRLRLSGCITENYLNFDLRICKGPFDDNLSWPFDRNIQLSIINQSTDGVYKTWSINCSKYLNEVSLNKPTNENASFYICSIRNSEITAHPYLRYNNEIIVKFSTMPLVNDQIKK